MKKLVVSSSPHIHSPVSTRRIMLDVIIALIPALVFAVIYFNKKMIIFCKHLCHIYTEGRISAIVMCQFLSIHINICRRIRTTEFKVIFICFR